MVLNHVAAILLFSGPLFYVGLWMAIDPAGFARLPNLIVRVPRKLVQTLGGLPSEETVEPERPAISQRLQTGVRFAGVVLVLLAIAI